MTEPSLAALAQAREAAGMSLEEAARQLKFAPRQLQALEAGELQRLPGGTFVRGMVRSYARLLRLDPEPLLAQVGAHAAPQDAERLAQRFSQPVPFSDGARRSNLAYVALSLALLAVVFAAFSLKPTATTPLFFVGMMTVALTGFMIGLILTPVLAYLVFVAVAYFIDPGAYLALIVGWIAGLAAFGLITAAIYTWAVDGRVPLRR